MHVSALGPQYDHHTTVDPVWRAMVGRSEHQSRSSQELSLSSFSAVFHRLPRTYLGTRAIFHAHGVAGQRTAAARPLRGSQSRRSRGLIRRETPDRLCAKGFSIIRRTESIRGRVTLFRSHNAATLTKPSGYTHPDVGPPRVRARGQGSMRSPQIFLTRFKPWIPFQGRAPCRQMK